MSYFKARSAFCFQACPGDFSIGAEMGKTGEGARRGGGPDPGLSSADLQANVQ